MQQYLVPNTAEMAAKIVDDEAILINLSNGMYYSLNPVACLTWIYIEAGYELNDISSAFAKRFSEDEDKVKGDVEALAQQFLDENIVIVSDSKPRVGEVKIPQELTGVQYNSPQLSKFEDMVDLFALDPPLPELTKLKGTG